MVSNYSKEQYEDYILQSEYFYVLERNGNVQGFLLAFHDDELDYDQVVNRKIQKYAKNNFVLIKQVCIARNAHKQGYGRKLYLHLMSNVEKDIFLSVVLEPYNEVSVEFHNNLGFKQIFTVIAEDQMKRGVFYWNNMVNESHYDKEIIMSQYDHAIHLYQHEDSLNWSKIHHLFYISGGLFGIISILTNAIKDSTQLIYCTLLAISALGILSSLLFQVTLKNGIEYMQKRKRAVVEIEKILLHLGGVEVVSINFSQSEKRFKKSPTTKAMKLIPYSITFIWIVIFITSLTSLL